MKHFTSINDVDSPFDLVKKAKEIKSDPHLDTELGKNKVLGLIFFNSSLRTRMSTTRAAYNLGMQVMVLNVSSDSWQLETQDGVIMDGGKAEHIKEAIPAMGSYCDILGVRSFPTFENREGDYQDHILNSFKAISGKPIVNLESATLHPLQSLTDLLTIEEYKKMSKPKVVLTWAPHIKALPQAVANSFSQWINETDYNFTIAQPDGFELLNQYTEGATITHNQQDALEDADFVYVKNWSSYHDYGKIGDHSEWMIDNEKLEVTNNAKVMHCLPVRRNVVIADDVLDGPNSIVTQQAENRLYAAQAVLKELLESEKR